MTENEVKEAAKIEKTTRPKSSYYEKYMASIDESKKSSHVFKEKIKKRVRKSKDLSLLKKCNPFDVLVKPMIETEKGHKFMEEGKYIFRVHNKANKNDIKVAFRAVFNVTPVRVNIINVPFKGRNNRKLVRRGFKKAIVFLKKGEKIELVK